MSLSGQGLLGKPRLGCKVSTWALMSSSISSVLLLYKGFTLMRRTKARKMFFKWNLELAVQGYSLKTRSNVILMIPRSSRSCKTLLCAYRNSLGTYVISISPPSTNVKYIVSHPHTQMQLICLRGLSPYYNKITFFGPKSSQEFFLGHLLIEPNFKSHPLPWSVEIWSTGRKIWNHNPERCIRVKAGDHQALVLWQLSQGISKFLLIQRDVWNPAGNALICLVTSAPFRFVPALPQAAPPPSFLSWVWTRGRSALCLGGSQIVRTRKS